jgi:hypothetical protein
MKNNYIGWMMTLSGAMFITMGHYFNQDTWGFVYILCPIVGFMTTVVLDGDGA